MTMREILFRGKNGCLWAYGHVRKLDVKTFMYEKNCYPSVLVHPNTVGQYTGIEDKTGIPIYEGDIIRAVLPETVACREYVWPLMAVAFHEGAFGVWQNARDFTPLRSFASRVEFEVVGNIHDNPDMIGGA